jgi:hypothetical protein
MLISRVEAAARVLTLVRLAMSYTNTDSFVNQIPIFASNFHKSQLEIWRPWLQEIVILSVYPRFFDMVSELYSDMTYRSSIYVKKYGSLDLQNSIRSLCVAGPGAPQIAAMEALDAFCNGLFTVDLMEHQEQKEMKTFTDLAIKLLPSELANVDLLEIRKRRVMKNPFERAVRNLSKSQFRAVSR